MRRSALTPIARRMRDKMAQRNPDLGGFPTNGAAFNDYTEVTINLPKFANASNGIGTNGLPKMTPPGRILRDYIGPDILILTGTFLAFIGSAVTLLGNYGDFSSPETKPFIIGLGPPLVGIGFLFCLLRLFFCRAQSIPCYKQIENMRAKSKTNAVHPSDKVPSSINNKIPAANNNASTKEPVSQKPTNGQPILNAVTSNLTSSAKQKSLPPLNKQRLSTSVSLETVPDAAEFSDTYNLKPPSRTVRLESVSDSESISNGKTAR